MIYYPCSYLSLGVLNFTDSPFGLLWSSRTQKIFLTKVKRSDLSKRFIEIFVVGGRGHGMEFTSCCCCCWCCSCWKNMLVRCFLVVFAVLMAVACGETVVGDGSVKGFIYSSEDMGIYNTTSCSSAPSCGTTMATFNGIAAKSNGVNQCTGSSCGGYGTYGYHYQCVELAQRYFGEKHGTTAIWHVNAKDMCSTHPSGVSKTSSPKPGDLFVRTSGTYGHVAVITAVYSSTVDVIEQNSSPSGRNTYHKSDAGCFLTAGK